MPTTHAGTRRSSLCRGLSSATLAAPWAALWFHQARLRLCSVPLALVLLAVPPLGIIGCASPLTAAGVLFPGLAWTGLLLTLLVCGLLASHPLRAIALTVVFALPAQILYRPPRSPADWQGMSTHFGGVGLDTPDPLADYDAAQSIQETALNSSARMIVFPETVVSNWNEATDAFGTGRSRHSAADARLEVPADVPQDLAEHVTDLTQAK